MSNAAFTGFYALLHHASATGLPLRQAYHTAREDALSQGLEASAIPSSYDELRVDLDRQIAEAHRAEHYAGFYMLFKRHLELMIDFFRDNIGLEESLIFEAAYDAARAASFREAVPSLQQVSEKYQGWRAYPSDSPAPTSADLAQPHNRN